MDLGSSITDDHNDDFNMLIYMFLCQWVYWHNVCDFPWLCYAIYPKINPFPPHVHAQFVDTVE